MPGATTARLVVCAFEMPMKLFMMPQTVPNSPTNGAVEPIVAKIPCPAGWRAIPLRTISVKRIAVRSLMPFSSGTIGGSAEFLQSAVEEACKNAAIRAQRCARFRPASPASRSVAMPPRRAVAARRRVRAFGEKDRPGHERRERRGQRSPPSRGYRRTGTSTTATVRAERANACGRLRLSEAGWAVDNGSGNALRSWSAVELPRHSSAGCADRRSPCWAKQAGRQTGNSRVIDMLQNNLELYFSHRSHLGPESNQIVIDARKLHEFRRVTSESLYKSLDGRCRDRKSNCAPARRGPCFAARRMMPSACAARDRPHRMQASGGIKHKIAGRQLHFMRAIIVLDHEYAAVILVRLRQKQRDREVGANAHAGQWVAAHRVVDMHAEMLALAVAIEQRRKDVEWNGR